MCCCICLLYFVIIIIIILFKSGNKAPININKRHTDRQSYWSYCLFFLPEIGAAGLREC